MIFLLIFALEAIVLYKIEVFNWKKKITPLNLLMIPYIVATSIAIVYPYFDKSIPHFYMPSLVVWMVGLAIFEIPSFIIATGNKKSLRSLFVIKEGKRDDFYKVLCFIASGCIALSLLRMRSLSGQMDLYGTDEFSSQYQTSGLMAHLTVLLNAIFSYSIYKIDRNHKFCIFIIVGTLIGMYAVGTKSWIIAPILIGYYARLLTGKTRATLKTVLLPIIIIMAIFFLSYYIILIVAYGNEASADFIVYLVNHFIQYVCGGSLTLSIDYQRGFLEPDMTEALFGPLLNILNAMMGEPYIRVINPIFIHLGTLGDNNVRTFFGTFYAYSKSPILFFVLSLIFSAWSYITYALSNKSRSIFLLLANCSNMTFLTFGFFDFYWLTLSSYEFYAIFIAMHFMLYL